jgi:cytochrome c oxidase subunit 4
MANASSPHDNHGHGGHHVFSDVMLKRTFIVLCSLTILTVVLALIERGYGDFFGVRVEVPHIEFGWLSVPIALGIAGAKSYFVAANFMGLKHDKGTNLLVFVGSLVFLVIFFGFTYLDFATRDTFEPLSITPKDVLEQRAINAEAENEAIQEQFKAVPLVQESDPQLFGRPAAGAAAAPDSALQAAPDSTAQAAPAAN